MSRLDQLTKLLAADPADADVMYMLAQEHAKSGDHATAVSWYDKCLAASPAYHYAFFHKAKSQEAAGDVAAALATLREGRARAIKAGDAKASSELSAYLDELEP